MTSNALVSRQATADHSGLAARQANHDHLMVRAKMMAAAPSDMLPKYYRNNPGACMMAADWADRNDVSIFEALGEVAFVYGKPVVSAVLQKKLAARHGYRTQVIASDPAEATVAVIGPDGVEVGGEGNGRCTYTLDMAKGLGIYKGDIWQADPAHMLIKRATTRALEYFGPSELAPLMVDVADDDTEIEAPPRNESDTTESAPVAAPEPDKDDQAIEGVEVSEQGLRDALKAKKLKVGDAVRHISEQGHEGLGTIGDIAADPQAADVLAAWIEAQ